MSSIGFDAPGLMVTDLNHAISVNGTRSWTQGVPQGRSQLPLATSRRATGSRRPCRGLAGDCRLPATRSLRCNCRPRSHERHHGRTSSTKPGAPDRCWRPESPCQRQRPTVSDHTDHPETPGPRSPLYRTVGAVRVPGPHQNCLRGRPFGWSRVVPTAERRPPHRPLQARPQAVILPRRSA